jgi:hypothetical protein
VSYTQAVSDDKTSGNNNSADDVSDDNKDSMDIDVDDGANTNTNNNNMLDNMMMVDEPLDALNTSAVSAAASSSHMVSCYPLHYANRIAL